MTESTERWLPVVGYEGYEVSDQGRVRSVDRVIRQVDGRTRRFRGRVLSQWADPVGRMQIKLGRKDLRRVHSLVLTAFVGPAPEGHEGCHNNGNASDNRLSNLRWDNHSNNMYDRVRHGGNPQHERTHCPRGHELVEPNNVAVFRRRGHRGCLCCARARAAEQRALKRGESFDFEADANARYADLMGSRRAA